MNYILYDLLSWFEISSTCYAISMFHIIHPNHFSVYFSFHFGKEHSFIVRSLMFFSCLIQEFELLDFYFQLFKSHHLLYFKILPDLCYTLAILTLIAFVH